MLGPSKKVVFELHEASVKFSKSLQFEARGVGQLWMIGLGEVALV